MIKRSRHMATTVLFLSLNTGSQLLFLKQRQNILITHGMVSVLGVMML